jgi:hypothetical protein
MPLNVYISRHIDLLQDRSECREIINFAPYCLTVVQPSQSHPDIINFREAGIGVYTGGEVTKPSLKKYHEWSKLS